MSIANVQQHMRSASGRKNVCVGENYDGIFGGVIGRNLMYEGRPKGVK